VYSLGNCGKFLNLSIKETNSFRGIPYADYFTVNTEWIVICSREGGCECTVKILLDFEFLKSTWLQGTIESNTRAELLTVYELWLSSAEEHLQQIMVERQKGVELFTADISASQSPLVSPRDMQHHDLETGISSSSSYRNSKERTSFNSTRGSGQGDGIQRLRSRDAEDNKSLTTYGSDDEMQFFDCEEERLWYDNEVDREKDEKQHLLPVMNSGPNRRMTTPEKELRIIYSQPNIAVPSEEISTVKDLAVSIVEAVFVLAEFSFWKVHRIYTHDLRVLFDVEPSEVFIRICNSFIPGWHSPVLLKPDLYGPFIAVLMMPQILLLSMGVTRHGCNQSSLLGNAVVVSLCLWIGLSSLYRLLAFVIAPTLDMRHCLSITGYSFFAWNLSLLLSIPLESNQGLTGLPVFLPLFLFGLPSAIAQGCMFWEHTPASSLTLQPTAFPSSLQQCASQHIRCLQRVAWAIPKLFVFVIVAGTHYQFLWYVARVFLPGKKELCQLSALVQPSQYADIITQKELRQYALKLLSGKKHS
jgi:hypothetical protein